MSNRSKRKVRAVRKGPPEVMTVSGGLGVVSIRGGRDGSVLSIAGEPVQSDSSDFGGSLGWLAKRYVPWPGTDDPYLIAEWVEPDAWRRLREWLADPVPIERLAEPLSPLLMILESGEYCLELTTLPWVNVIKVKPGQQSCWYAGGFGDSWTTDVIPTHRWRPSGGTVRRYREQLIAGGRPAAVVLAHSEAEVLYLLDGHHKLAAYLDRGLDPVCVVITRLPPHELSRHDMPQSWPASRPIWET